MRFRALHLAQTPWFRNVEADTFRQAAEITLQHPLGKVTEWWHGDLEGVEMVTFITSDGWVSVTREAA